MDGWMDGWMDGCMDDDDIIEDQYHEHHRRSILWASSKINVMSIIGDQYYEHHPRSILWTWSKINLMNITEDPSYEHHRRSFLWTSSKILPMNTIEHPSHEHHRTSFSWASSQMGSRILMLASKSSCMGSKIFIDGIENLQRWCRKSSEMGSKTLMLASKNFIDGVGNLDVGVKNLLWIYLCFIFCTQPQAWWQRMLLATEYMWMLTPIIFTKISISGCPSYFLPWPYIQPGTHTAGSRPNSSNDFSSFIKKDRLTSTWTLPGLSWDGYLTSPASHHLSKKKNFCKEKFP